MDAAEAISLVAEWILWENLDYPTEGLEAERFEAGWVVYAPPAVGRVASVETRVGRSVFLVGDSGRIEEVSPSTPLRRAQAEFATGELVAQDTGGESDESELLAEFERQIRQAEFGNPSATGGFTVDDAAPRDGGTQASGEES